MEVDEETAEDVFLYTKKNIQDDYLHITVILHLGNISMHFQFRLNDEIINNLYFI